VKTILRPVFLTLFLVFCCHSTIAHAQVQNQIGEISLQMDELDANVIFRKEYNDESSFPVKVLTQEGSHLDGRIEVSGSFSRRFPKKNLVIKLNDGQQWKGYSKISLDAMATDGSLMRKWLVWQLIEDLGMVGPKAEFIRVNINGQYRGIFLLTEWVGPDLFERHDLGRNGQFFHPDDATFCGDFKTYTDKPIHKCWKKLSPKDDNFDPLVTLYQKINDTPSEVFDQFLDNTFYTDSVINWIVINVLTSNGDTYNKNYFLYQPETTGKWLVVPWDYDLTFGRNWDPYLPFPKNILNENFQYFYPLQLGASNPLKEKVLENPLLQQRVIDKILLLLGLRKQNGDPNFGWFSPVQMKQRIDRMAALINEAQREDPFRLKQSINFAEETQSLWHYVQRRQAYLNEILRGEYRWSMDEAGMTTTDAEREPLQITLRVRQSITTPGNYELITAPAYGYTLAGIKLVDHHGPAEFTTESEIDQTPSIIPKGHPQGACVQRVWYLGLMTPFQERLIDLQLDYIEENSHRTEAEGVNEQVLTLWALDGEKWTKLNTQVNTASNVLTVRNLKIQPGTLMRFAACEDLNPSEGP